MAKNELKKPAEVNESKGLESIETLNLEGLKKRYEVIKSKVGEKMLENDKTIKRLITEITIGSGKSFKKEKMNELDSLLKMHEENQGLMEKTAESLEASIKEIPKTTATENISTGKFVSNEGNIESKHIRFENEIPSALEGVLSLEITNKPPKEVGNNFGTGELHLIPGVIAGKEKLGISVNGKNLEVKEVYENIDGSWTINAGKYEFRTEGPLPQVIESPAPQITKEE